MVIEIHSQTRQIPQKSIAVTPGNHKLKMLRIALALLNYGSDCVSDSVTMTSHIAASMAHQPFVSLTPLNDQIQGEHV
jgi:hypothetical protein